MKTLTIVLSILFIAGAASADQLAYDYSFPQEFTSRPAQRLGTKIYKLPVGKTEQMKRIEITADIYHDGWNSFQYHGTYKHLHGLFWITRGKKWGGHVLAWAALKDQNNRFKLGTNIDRFSAFTPGTEKKFSAVPTPRQWHRVNFVYDASLKKLSITMTNQRGQQITVISPTTSTKTTIANRYGYYQLHFGHNFAEHGPETSTDGWKIRNLRAKFYK